MSGSLFETQCTWEAQTAWTRTLQCIALIYLAKVVVASGHYSCTWLLDAEIHNAWIIARSAGSDLPQLEFRRQIATNAQMYVVRYRAPTKAPGRPATAAQSSTGSCVSDELRYDGIPDQQATTMCWPCLLQCRSHGVQNVMSDYACSHTSKNDMSLSYWCCCK